MCGAVAHGQYVIVAGDVAVAGKVIGALGEAGGHSVGSLENTHCWLCKGQVGTEGERQGEISETLKQENSRHRWSKRIREKDMQYGGSSNVLLLGLRGRDPQQGTRPG